MHNQIQIRTQDTHRGIRKAVDHVKDELVWINPDLSKTSVKLRLDSELIEPARREYCSTLPPLLWAEWETSEPGADRIYWELRGPKDSQGTLPYIDSGYAENGRDDGTVGGSFYLDMTDYAPMLTPLETAEYHLSVLPLTAATGAIVMGQWGGGIGNSAFEPQPPTGIGPWSPPAIIKIGEECRSAPTIFDFHDVDYFRHLRVKVKWFKVDSDQPGPGDEEYHLTAFMLKSGITTVWDGYHLEDVAFIQSLGRWESYFSVAEGDHSKKPFSWTSPQIFLPGPGATQWPSFTVVLSVLEEDGGEMVEDFYEMMDELFQDAMHGAVADQLADIQREVQEIIDDAREELHETLAEEMWAYISGIVGAALVNALAAIVAAAAAIIGAWIRAGAVDDFFGIRVVQIVLKSNDLARLKAGDGWIVESNGPLAGTGATSAQSQGSQFISEDIVVQMKADSPDAAGSSGTVSVGLSLEFSDLRTTTY